MTKYSLPFILILTCLFSFPDARGQAASQLQPEASFRLAFYNVENLFDTKDDPDRDDQEFLPQGKNHWDTRRYLKKLDRISEALAGLKSGNFPAAVGLCEVENRKVVEKLVSQPRLKKAGYKVIHHESPDERGIDNALIYDPSQFKVLSDRAIRVDLTQFGDKTRDILYVTGVPIKAKNDTLHIFVNHWPSRSEGKDKSGPKRTVAANTLRHAVDSIFRFKPTAGIIIIGDFNDEPNDPSVNVTLLATEVKNIRPGGLYNLMMDDYKQGKGTIFWKDWDMFDQIIVSGQLILNKEGLAVAQPKGSIFDAEWLMFKSDKGDLRPNRTLAREYYGGYSDHLPVYIDLKLE